MSLPTPYYDKDGITIYCGDCRDILPHIQSASAALIFTDPPYGHNNNNNGDLIHNWEKALGKPSVKLAEARPIANDGHEDANGLVRWMFQESRRLLDQNGCCCCCCGGGGPDPQFARWSLWMDEHLAFKQMIVWDKGPMGMGWHYRRSYETILVGQRSAKCNWYDETNAIENIIRPGSHGISKIIPSSSEHPTPKPWQLPAHFIKLHSLPGDLVIDPFNGGGSTAEACQRMGRKYIGVELSEEYCAMTVERLAQGNLFGLEEPA